MLSKTLTFQRMPDHKCCLYYRKLTSRCPARPKILSTRATSKPKFRFPLHFPTVELFVEHARKNAKELGIAHGVFICLLGGSQAHRAHLAFDHPLHKLRLRHSKRKIIKLSDHTLLDQHSGCSKEKVY